MYAILINIFLAKCIAGEQAAKRELNTPCFLNPH